MGYLMMNCTQSGRRPGYSIVTGITTRLADPLQWYQSLKRLVMADNLSAGVIKPPAIPKSDNYRTWAMKLKANIKVMGAWGMVGGTDVAPLPTAPADSLAAEIATHRRVKAAWDSKWDNVGLQ